MDLSLEQIQEMLRDYVPSDVYTVDETGLFFRASPNNAPSHVLGCVALSNVRVVMFAPHLGMKVQPMRGGILTAFKGKYRLKHLTLAIDHLEDGLSDVYHVTQIQAMSWSVDAWQQTSKETIVNAWKPLGITAPFSLDSSMEADDKNVEEELWGLLYCLQLSCIVNTKT
ncbi:hypothetical protein PC128_g27649 [Phytophthora cactorum]|nr:hypothetical protein PC128_g27649 [Phytophthora cactorum]